MNKVKILRIVKKVSLIILVLAVLLTIVYGISSAVYIYNNDFGQSWGWKDDIVITLLFSSPVLIGLLIFYSIISHLVKKYNDAEKK